MKNHLYQKPKQSAAPIKPLTPKQKRILEIQFKLFHYKKALRGRLRQTIAWQANRLIPRYGKIETETRNNGKAKTEQGNENHDHEIRN